MAALLESGLLSGGDGAFNPERVAEDHLAGPGLDLDYRLTGHGLKELRAFGVDFAAPPTRRPLVRYCVDWSEQRHHLACAAGAALADRMFELGWLSRAARSRAVRVTDAGYRGLHQTFGLELGFPGY